MDSANSHPNSHSGHDTNTGKTHALHDQDETSNEDCSPVIDKLIEEIRRITKKRKIFQENHSYFPCHYCKELLENKHLVHCTKTSCARYFCLKCLSGRFFLQTKDILDLMKRTSWDCFVCRNVCLCRSCRDTAEALIPAWGPLGDTTKKDKTEKTTKTLKKFIAPKKKMEKTTKSNTTDKAKTPTKIEEKNRKDEKKNSDRKVIPQTELKIEQKIEDKTPTKTINKGTVGICHLCSKSSSYKDSIKCSIDTCNKRYCTICVKKTIDKNFILKNANPDYWICYACGKTCPCDKCTVKRKEEALLLGVRRRPKENHGHNADNNFGDEIKKKRKISRSRSTTKSVTKETTTSKEAPQDSKQNENSRSRTNSRGGKRKGSAKPANKRGVKPKIDQSNPNFSQYVSKKKVEINTTVSTMNHPQGSPSCVLKGGVKIIQEIKSEDYSLTVYDAENVEELRKMEKSAN